MDKEENDPSSFDSSEATAVLRESVAKAAAQDAIEAARRRGRAGPGSLLPTAIITPRGCPRDHGQKAAQAVSGLPQHTKGAREPHWQHEGHHGAPPRRGAVRL